MITMFNAGSRCIDGLGCMMAADTVAGELRAGVASVPLFRSRAVAWTARIGEPIWISFAMF